ncbi:MAG: PEP-CTERM sorting domain-containing protein, partial [Verrucomicrobia bacterium]|nr:PEP-CTERM sorting domain-containing protein [Verrucomicrobiota bacterium]
KSENFGALTLSGSSTIDLSGTSPLVHFADSTASWTGNLTIENWSGTPVSGGGPEQLVFGSTSGGAGGNVGQIFFHNPTGWDPGIYFSTILGTGEVIPVPEPATWIGVGALIALLGFRERRRLQALLARLAGAK